MLSDSKILERISEFKFDTENKSRPFEAATQVNAASINLRLSNTYWASKVFNETPVSFKPDAFGSETVNRYQKVVIKNDDKIVLKPKCTILCRTYEKFYIPTDLAGRLHSRSSFSRLGIEVAGTGDFINPGWEGHMPLLIRNNSNITVHLKPFMPIVQLCFDEVTGSVKTPYSAQKTGAKYADDEGGPSAIWQSLCREGLNLSGFSGQKEDIDKIIQFGKRMNAPTLKMFLKSLTEHSKLETAKDVSTAFNKTVKNHILLLKVLTILATPILSAFISDAISSGFPNISTKSAGVVVTPIIVVIMFVYYSSLTSKYNSNDELLTFWKEVGFK